MIVRCPECGQKGKLDDGYSGRTVKCPGCAVAFVAEAVTSSKKETKWYYAVGADKHGPVDQETFDSLINNGTVTPETLVWCKGMDSWHPLAETGVSLGGWYYAVGADKHGPVDQETFDSLITDGTVTPETLVWCKGMDSWHPLAETGVSFASDEPALQVCSECEGRFSPDMMMDHEGAVVCEKCKLDLLHKKQEQEQESVEDEFDVEVSGLTSGGLGGRIMAKVIDCIFMLALGGMVEGLSRKLFPESFSTGPVNEVFTVTLIINMLLGIFYVVWFVGKFGATPGKMVAKLKIVNADGSKMSYGQAFGRYCGEFVVVALTLSLGYLFAFFDKKRRALHDRLCKTWVVEA